MRPAAPLIAAGAIWLAWGVSWLAAGRWHARTVARAPSAPVRARLLAGMVGLAGLFVEVPGRVPPLFVLPSGAQWMLVALIATGVAFAWWARLHLGRLWSGGIVTRDGHRLIESGPYGIVRHPIYTGLFAAAIGLAMLKATPLAIGGAILLTAAFTSKARLEERFLAAELGGGTYDGYRRRVPMLLPLPRRRA